MFSTKSLASKGNLTHMTKYFASKELVFGTQARKKLL